LSWRGGIGGGTVAWLDKGGNLDQITADSFDKIFLRQDGNRYLYWFFLFSSLSGRNIWC